MKNKARAPSLALSPFTVSPVHFPLTLKNSNKERNVVASLTSINNFIRNDDVIVAHHLQPLSTSCTPDEVNYSLKAEQTKVRGKPKRKGKNSTLIIDAF